ncbi:metal ABC transporter ATP-binding protein [Quadrisphaera sp. DSM 44207]|uniref:metal ABC transporter ATP-binding protein n=1 Tax=Quadrisphaera sp. DSM 44207 TaxID=1881057 RepID=UPI001C40AAE6|nr:metal ABC transporter ATP-binding protein [Quadrisphaera sp. DSM 44207]
MSAAPHLRRPPSAAADAAVLSYRRCSLGYRGVPVVRDVDLQVRPRDCLALLGPNGSGKTTLVRGALGLAEVLSGELEVLGTGVAHLRRRAALGYVPQRHTVAASVPVTVAEVVAVGRLPRTGPLRRLTPAARRRDRLAVSGALEAVGLADRARSSVAQLSGGQQRRVLIARALAAEPEVLLLDEPTAGVDEENQHALVEVLAELSSAGTTMVIVTHELAAVRGLVDRAVRLVDGRVVEDRRLPAEPGAAGRRAHPTHPDEDHPADHHDHEDHGSGPRGRRRSFLTGPAMER